MSVTNLPQSLVPPTERPTRTQPQLQPPRLQSLTPSARPSNRQLTRLIAPLHALLLLLAAALFALHYLHLAADFPNHSPWMDWAKYTDEGWYGDAAIRHFLLGHWYVPGDFNPAAALPVWPLVEAALFRLTGVGVVPARALTVSVFGLSLVCAYLLINRELGGLNRDLRGRTTPALAPAAAVLLLAASPFCFAFMRMAILEPLLVLLTLLALMAASSIAPYAATALRRLLPVIAIGLLLPLMILTKTTAVFLFPAIFFMLAARSGFHRRATLRAGLTAAGIGCGLWLLYFGLIVRPHYLEDYRYLFSANAYTGITLATARDVLENTLRDTLWVGPLLIALALAAIVLALWSPSARRNPLAISLLLWTFGYLAFLAYHDNLQPRYYLVIAVPVTMLLPLLLELLWRSPGRALPVLASLLAVALLPLVLLDARQTVHYTRSPEYTFLRAAEQIQRIVRSDPARKGLLLSISGSDLTLMTGLPSICDDFGTLELEDRVKAYKPGWYASWNQVEDDKMDALTPRYHLERVAAFPALDDPYRNLLILYRLDPAEGYRPPHHPRRRPLPASLVSHLGQQPSALQLQH